jgi:uncharacterized protein YndB with AHSA1/START domain
MSETMKTRTAYINAPVDQVWRALTDPELTVQYVGGRVQSTWRPGDEVVYLAPDSDARLLEGHIIEIEPLRRLRLRSRWLFAPELAADKPHRETFELEALGNVTRLTATFDEYEEGSASYYACDMARTGDSLKTLLESGTRLFAQTSEAQ